MESLLVGSLCSLSTNQGLIVVWHLVCVCAQHSLGLTDWQQQVVVVVSCSELSAADNIAVLSCFVTCRPDTCCHTCPPFCLLQAELDAVT